MVAVVMPELSAATVSVDESVYPTGLYPWYIVAVLLVVSTLSYMDRQALTMLVVPIQADLGLSETQCGLLLGPAFMIFYALAGMPMGSISDHSNRRNLLTVGLLVWSSGTFAAGFARNIEELFVTRALVGLGEACLVPASYSLIGDYFAPSRRGKAIAIMALGGTAGVGLSLLGGGAVLGLMEAVAAHPLPLLGHKMPWELVFLTFGSAGILAAILMLTVREPTRWEIRRRRDDTKESFLSFLRMNGASIFFILAPFILGNIVFIGCAAWSPTLIVRRYGLTLGHAAMLYGGVMVVGASFGTMIGGVLGDHLARTRQTGRFLLLIIFSPILIPALAFICLGTQLWLFVAGTAGLVFVGGLMSSVAYVVVQDIAPAGVRGRALAFYTVLAQLIGLGLGPTSVAMVTQHVLGDRALLNYSLLITITPVAIMIVACALLGASRFRAIRLVPPSHPVRKGLL